MKLVSADLDRSRAEVVITIDLENPVAEGQEPEAPYVLTYGTDQRGQGDAPSNESTQDYRTRLRDWLKDVRREARLMADLQVPAVPDRDDVKADIAPAID